MFFESIFLQHPQLQLPKVWKETGREANGFGAPGLYIPSYKGRANLLFSGEMPFLALL